MVRNDNCFFSDWSELQFRGHNELDDPSLTQPLMYEVIDKKLSVPDAYSRRLEVQAIKNGAHI